MNITLQNILLTLANGWDLSSDQLAYVATHGEHITLKTEEYDGVVTCYATNSGVLTHFAEEFTGV